MYEAIADAQLAILPASSHALLKEHPALSTRIIRHFLTESGPPKTLMPLRRAARQQPGDSKSDL